MSAWSLEQEAAQAYEFSLVYCGECRDYHMTRALLKASGHQLGPERDQVPFASMLRRFATTGARVLIAGAADTGVLAVTLSAIGDLAPQITVVDKCRTPLILCQRFAAANGTRINVIEEDLVTARLGTFDLVVGHVVLSFIPPDQRLAFLRNMSDQLSPRGTFLLAMTVRRPGPRRPRTSPEKVMSRLRERGVSVPGDGTLVVEALRRQLDPAKPSPERASPSAVEKFFPEVGLKVVEVLDTAAELPKESDLAPPSRLYFALGRAERPGQ